MKQKLFLFIAAVFFCLTAGAQETLYKSTSLIGIWNQLQPYPIDSVRMAWIPTGNFKIYNVDRTFLLFINNGKGLTAITAYGEYDGRKPGEFTETLHFHAYSKELNSGNSKSTLRYKMQNDSVMQVEFYNENIKKWVPELWRRVTELHTKRK